MRNPTNGTSALKLDQAVRQLADTSEMIALSITPHFRNKDIIATWQSYTNDTGETTQGTYYAYTDFHPVIMNEAQIVETIRRGNAIAVCELGNHSGQSSLAYYRKADYGVSWQVLGLDLDYTSISEALRDDIIRDYAFYLYATPSHKETNKHNPDGQAMTRALFILDKPIRDRSQYVDYVTRLHHALNVATDESCKDAARIFFGSTKARTEDEYRAGLRLPIDVLDSLPVVETQQAGKRAQSTAKVQQHTRGNTQEFYAINAPRIRQALGISSIAANGWAFGFQCPCSHHNNGDNKASAAWYEGDTAYLHCYANDRTYTMIQVADMLGIPIIPTDKRAGLYNTIRQHLVESKQFAIARLLDAYYMAGNEGGVWLDIEGVEHAIAGFLHHFKSTPKSKALYNLMSATLQGIAPLENPAPGQARQPFIFSKKGSVEHRFFDGSLFFPENVPYSYDTYSSSGQNEEKIPKGRGRPKTYYYIPTQLELAHLFGIRQQDRRPFPIAALASNKDYRVHDLDRYMARLGRVQASRKQLGHRHGVSGKTARRYIKNNPKISVKSHTKKVERLTTAEGLPPHDDTATPKEKWARGFYWLQVQGDSTRYPYTRSSAEGLLKNPANDGLSIYVYAPDANEYIHAESVDSTQSENDSIVPQDNKINLPKSAQSANSSTAETTTMATHNLSDFEGLQDYQQQAMNEAEYYYIDASQYEDKT